MIYAIEACGLDLVKIGKSNKPKSRLGSFKTSSPVPLRLLAVADWHDTQERLIHQIFHPWRRSGEWFAAEGPVAEFVTVMMCPEGTPEQIFESAMGILANTRDGTWKPYTGL